MNNNTHYNGRLSKRAIVRRIAARRIQQMLETGENKNYSLSGMARRLNYTPERAARFVRWMAHKNDISAIVNKRSITFTI